MTLRGIQRECFVIPEQHAATVFDIAPDDFALVSRLVVRTAVAVRDALRPPGLSLVQANGEAAHQTVPHLHVHILPRQKGDGLLLNWDRSGHADPSRIAEVADLIRRRLRRS
jgi:histidine triad (HIT) family protein